MGRRRRLLCLQQQGSLLSAILCCQTLQNRTLEALYGLRQQAHRLLGGCSLRREPSRQQLAYVQTAGGHHAAFRLTQAIAATAELAQCLSVISSAVMAQR